MPVQDHPVFQAVRNHQYPDPSVAPAWRYMEDWKFRSLLSNRALYFSRLDRLEDQFEGSWTRIAAARFVEWFTTSTIAVDGRDGRTFHISERPEMLELPGVADFLGGLAQEAMARLSRLRQEVAVSCWHVQDWETKAMWDLYMPREAKGVAIRSSYNRLRRAVTSPLPVYMGFVAYVDWVNTPIHYENGLWRVIYKHEAFWPEQELRLACHSDSEGLMVEVDLNALIDFVVVKPESGEEYRAEIEALLSEHVAEPKALLSSLDEPRHY